MNLPETIETWMILEHDISEAEKQIQALKAKLGGLAAIHFEPKSGHFLVALDEGIQYSVSIEDHKITSVIELEPLNA